MAALDAVVVGAGPNGLTAAAILARAGLEVEVIEAAETVGGGARTQELTLPGFAHDPCSAVHPLAVRSPAFRSLPLKRHGLEWIQPELPLAHPLGGSATAILDRSVARTVEGLGRDGAAYRRLIEPFLGRWPDLAADTQRAPLSAWPTAPLLYARFGTRAVFPAALLSRLFRGDRGRVLVGGLGAHAIAPLGTPMTGGVALMFALAAHHGGWPIPRGGSQAIADALAGHVRALGSTIRTGRPIGSWDQLPAARAYVFDTAPEDLVRLAGSRLPPAYVRGVAAYRRGPGVVKVDYALDGPVPWTAPECRRAGTVHVGAPYGEIHRALRDVARGRAPRRPFLITAQPSVFDPSRAPAGRHVFWAYAHVPNGWIGDLLPRIEAQLERFAPGFTDRVLARAAAGPAEVEARNPNNIGGDVAGGRFAGRQTLFRPILARVPYATGNPSIYLCSSSTPPGPGVHGMSGYHAARTVLDRVFGIRIPADGGGASGSGG